MYPVVLDIYGPIKINGFSLCILISISIFIYLIKKDINVKKFFDKYDVIDLISETAIAAIIGGRFLHVINNYDYYSNIIDIFKIYNGGLAVIGALISGIIYLFYALKKRRLNVISILDIAAAYIPIVHCISRVGCFLAGCCYGISCNQFWAINSKHPTQLYSSLIFLILFIIQQVLYKKYKLNDLASGLLFFIYLTFLSIERFSIDFLRAEREYYYNFDYISKAQIQSILILVIALVILNYKKPKYEYI